jgi:hypothetical protein
VIGRRIQYEFCSFVPPAEFCFHNKALANNFQDCGDVAANQSAVKSLSLTLFRNRFDPDVPPISDCPDDMRPGAFPDTLMLNATGCCMGFDPLGYLRTTDAALRGNLRGFQVDYYLEDNIGLLRAARSQCSFEANFKLFRLSYAWITDGMLVNTSLLTADTDPESGWDTLTGFVRSVRFSE